MPYARTMDPAIVSLLALMARNGEQHYTVGRLLCARDSGGAVVALDPQTGGEVKRDAPVSYVLSTDGEATDGNLVRQHWNLERMGAGVMPILVNHGVERAPLGLGYWRDGTVIDLPGDANPRTGKPYRALVARAGFDLGDPMAAEADRKSRAGFAPSVSIGWIPGGRILRGDLPKDDPGYRDARTDECGLRTEGYVMGTEGDPNYALEASLTPLPADMRAVTIERMAAARQQIARIGGADRSALDLDAVLASLREHPGVRRFLTDLIRVQARAEFVAALQSDEGRALARAASAPPPDLSLFSFFGV